MGGPVKKAPCISHEISSIFQTLINKSTFLVSNQFWLSWRTRKGPLETNWECHRMAAILWIHELGSGKKYLANKGFHWEVQLLCLGDVFAFLYFPFNGNFSRYPCSCKMKKCNSKTELNSIMYKSIILILVYFVASYSHNIWLGQSCRKIKTRSR